MAKRENETRIDAFASEIESAAGENLVACFLYGALARGESRPGIRPDLAIILRDTSAAALDPLGPAIARWARAGERPPLVMSHAAWRASTDVFPIEVEDMREAHRLLRGRDPFQGVTTGLPDLRAELEREARGKLVQLHVHYAAASEDGKALAELVRNSVTTFFVLFRAALRLERKAPPHDHRELVRQTAAVAGFDAKDLEWALEQLVAERPARLEAHDEIGARYVDAIAQFVRYVDQATPSEGDRST